MSIFRSTILLKPFRLRMCFDLSWGGTPFAPGCYVLPLQGCSKSRNINVCVRKNALSRLDKRALKGHHIKARGRSRVVALFVRRWNARESAKSKSSPERASHSVIGQPLQGIMADESIVEKEGFNITCQP